jgi:anti-sigma factor RsiW
MNCSESRAILHAYVDDELDVRAAIELEAHLEHCGSCTSEHRALRQLSQTVRVHASRFTPSPELERRLRASIGAAARRETVSALPWWRRARFVASLAAALVLAWMGGAWWSRPSAEQKLGPDVVAAHVRSLLADHLIDVASSDRHTVNPWFQGKVPCSVGARDFEPMGFNLVGGRLDYLAGQPVAAVVYSHGPHKINVFVWPCETGADQPVTRFASNGYIARHWVQDGNHHWAVSDVDESALSQLVELWRSKS